MSMCVSVCLRRCCRYQQVSECTHVWTFVGVCGRGNPGTGQVSPSFSGYRGTRPFVLRRMGLGTRGNRFRVWGGDSSTHARTCARVPHTFELVYVLVCVVSGVRVSGPGVGAVWPVSSSSHSKHHSSPLPTVPRRRQWYRWSDWVKRRWVGPGESDPFRPCPSKPVPPGRG